MDAQNTKKNFKSGEIIIRQGDEGHNAYIIEKGRVEILVEQNSGTLHRVGTRGVGTIIGEMAIVDDAPRTATIKAIEDCELLEITRDDFGRRLNNADPVIKTVSQVILTRYRDTIARAEILRESPVDPDPESVERDYLEKSNAAETIKIANDFAEALKANDQLYLHYQPIILSSKRPN